MRRAVTFSTTWARWSTIRPAASSQSPSVTWWILRCLVVITECTTSVICSSTVYDSVDHSVFQFHISEPPADLPRRTDHKCLGIFSVYYELIIAKMFICRHSCLWLAVTCIPNIACKEKVKYSNMWYKYCGQSWFGSVGSQYAGDLVIVWSFPSAPSYLPSWRSLLSSGCIMLYCLVRMRMFVNPKVHIYQEIVYLECRQNHRSFFIVCC